MHNLPPDVLIEILLRLPLKSLSLFKCLSKLWYFLISDPKFTKRHVNLTMIDKDIEHERRRLILGSFSSLYYVEYEAMAFNDIAALELYLPVIKSSHDKAGAEKITNVGINHSIYVRCISLPSVYGFGYDHSLDDYNVIKITYKSLVYVYLLKTDTWRRAQNFPYNSSNGDQGIHLYGAVQWVFGGRKDSLPTRQTLIVAFDFAEGKFREVPRPSDAADYLPTIGVLGGCLCWLTHPAIGAAVRQHDFWVMKEYGVKESWTKVAINIPFLNLRPLSFLKNDEALLEIHRRLIPYSPRQGTYRELVINCIHGGTKLEMETDMVSLVSPK